MDAPDADAYEGRIHIIAVAPKDSINAIRRVTMGLLEKFFRAKQSAMGTRQHMKIRSFDMDGGPVPARAIQRDIVWSSVRLAAFRIGFMGYPWISQWHK
jgi:hypothetical protein